jgi:hypothetical protein
MDKVPRAVLQGPTQTSQAVPQLPNIEEDNDSLHVGQGLPTVGQKKQRNI